MVRSSFTIETEYVFSRYVRSQRLRVNSKKKKTLPSELRAGSFFVFLLETGESRAPVHAQWQGEPDLNV